MSCCEKGESGEAMSCGCYGIRNGKMTCLWSSEKEDEYFRASKIDIEDLIMTSLILNVIPRRTLKLKGITIPAFEAAKAKFIKENQYWINHSLKPVREGLGFPGGGK
jgi:hypothetical protein